MIYSLTTLAPFVFHYKTWGSCVLLAEPHFLMSVEIKEINMVAIVKIKVLERPLHMLEIDKLKERYSKDLSHWPLSLDHPTNPPSPTLHTCTHIYTYTQKHYTITMPNTHTHTHTSQLSLYWYNVPFLMLGLMLIYTSEWKEVIFSHIGYLLCPHPTLDTGIPHQIHQTVVLEKYYYSSAIVLVSQICPHL